MIASDPRMDEPECEQDESSSRCEDKPSSNSSTSLGPPTIHDFDILKPISRGAFGKVRKHELQNLYVGFLHCHDFGY